MVAHRRVQTAYREALLLESTLSQEGREAVSMVEKGYQCGKFDYAELLETKHALFNIREKQIDILYDYHISKAQLDRLTGGYS
jgi:outer membrane protein TolC